VPRRAAAIEAVYVTLAGVSATGVPPSAATGASGEPAVQLPHRGGELLMSRAGVSAPDVTPSAATGAAGEPARLCEGPASGGNAGRSSGISPAAKGERYCAAP